MEHQYLIEFIKPTICATSGDIINVEDYDFIWAKSKPHAKRIIEEIYGTYGDITFTYLELYKGKLKEL